MGTTSNFSSDARRQAAHILSRPPFTTKPVRIPDPLAGVLHAIGRAYDDTLGKIFSWLGPGVSSAARHVFGPYTWLALALIAIAVGVLIGVLLVRRRSRVKQAVATTVLDAPVVEDVGILEAAAEAAEARGDLEAAVRLRFRAGLTRLESAGIIASRLVTTTEQVRQAVQNPTFDNLATRHETIAYAGRTASPTDASSAREGWPRVIDEVAPAGKARKL